MTAQRIGTATNAGARPDTLVATPSHWRSLILLSAIDLSKAVRAGSAPIILDVRWTLGDPQGFQHYYDGHIPGAHYVDLTIDLSAGPNDISGRHPLPAPEAFVETVKGWGIYNDSSVVVYDDAGSTSAARAWWLLRWVGLEDVQILDGGLQAWKDIGGDLVVGPGTGPRWGGFELDPARADSPSQSAEIDEVAEDADDRILLDVRASARYSGSHEPMDSRAGHIPGARNLPTTEFIDDEGQFYPAEVLREKFATRGVTTGENVVVYCGSGIHACHALAAMEIAGLSGAKLFPGSWSQWSRDDLRPVETGADAACVLG